MNELPPPFPGPAIPATLKPDIAPPVRIRRLLLSLIVVVASFDFCFWGISSLGFSLAVFIPVLAGMILANREGLSERRTAQVLLVLLLVAAIATVVETGVTNVLVLLTLIIALAGETFFVDAESSWGRWLSQLVALVRAPGRIFWLGGALLEAAFSEGMGGVGSLVGGCLLAVPVIVLALVFGCLLASGNAVFSNWASTFFDWFWNQLALYLNFWRIALWGIVVLVILPLLRPVNVSAWWWRWTQRLPRLPEIVPARAALFSSGLILVVLNLLFFIANSADALFLWSGQALPSGVTDSGFVHNGVNALTVTVILSALVLTSIFQQALTVAQQRGLKFLGLFWIAQNLFLLLSVGLRLKLYIEDYNMTVARLGVIIFLVLVAAGYGLLTIKIIKDRSLSWLIGGCVLAVFATFYVTQFLNLAGWSANYNVAQWEKDRTRHLDLAYLENLGPAAIPALSRAANIDPTLWDNGESWQASGLSLLERSQFDWQHWREFSLRAWQNRGAPDDKK